MMFSRKDAGPPKGASSRSTAASKAKRVSQSLNNARKRISQSIMVKKAASPKSAAEKSETSFEAMYGGSEDGFSSEGWGSNEFQEASPPNSSSNGAWFRNEYDKARENALKQVLEEDESGAGPSSVDSHGGHLDVAEQYVAISGEDLIKRTSAIRRGH